MKIKNGSDIYEINIGTKKNRPWTRHGHNYGKYNKCLGMMMLTCIKQYLRNI